MEAAIDALFENTRTNARPHPSVAPCSGPKQTYVSNDRSSPLRPDLVTAAAANTKDRILDAAEALFADQGFEATSLRQITAAADANLAAVNYHFGSKDGLFGAVFARRITPVNEARMELLDDLETRAAPAAPQLEDVLEIFLRPALRLARTPQGARFMRLAGRVYTEPGAHWERIAAQFDVVRDRFLAAFRGALRDLPEVDLFWRVHFMIGVMCHTLADNDRLPHLSGGLCDSTDEDATLRQLVSFLSAGFRASTSTPPGPSPSTEAGS